MNSVLIEKFGNTKNGTEVKKFILRNDFLEIDILSYGCVIQKIVMPDKNGKRENIVLGMDNIKDYEDRSPSFGAIIGRTAGRTTKGILDINGIKYQLPINDHGANSIHGGINRLSMRVWKGTPIEREDSVGVEFKLFSPDMDEGYPGNVNLTIRYILKNDEFSIEYIGKTDKTTFLNMTNHSYFNLSGNCRSLIDGQVLQLNCDKFLAVDNMTLPKEIREVKGTPFDFLDPGPIGKAFDASYDQVDLVNGGIDNAFIINKTKNLNEAAKLTDIASGRQMEVITDQRAIVIYTGNYLGNVGKIANGVLSQKHMSICFETQDMPDILRFAPDKAVLCGPDKDYHQVTIFKFTVAK